MLGPFPVADAMARLVLLPELRLVGSAADLDTARQQEPAAVPAAFVVTSERGDKPKGASGGVLIQNINVAVSIVLFVRNFRTSATGAETRKEMDALQKKVRGQVLNWAPAIEFEPLSFQASRDEFYKAGLLCTQEIYRTSYRIEVRP